MQFPYMDLEEMAACLRPGDVMCHMFQNKGRESILDREGRVRPGIRKARERGVLHSLPRILSKYITFDLSLEQIFDAAIKMMMLRSNRYCYLNCIN